MRYKYNDQLLNKSNKNENTNMKINDEQVNKSIRLQLLGDVVWSNMSNFAKWNLIWKIMYASKALDTIFTQSQDILFCEISMWCTDVGLLSQRIKDLLKMCHINLHSTYLLSSYLRTYYFPVSGTN